MYTTSKKTCEALGIHPNTLRGYADAGKIKSIRTEGGHRRYALEEYLARKASEIWEVAPCNANQN